MKVLFLGYSDSKLIDFILENGDEVVVFEDKIDLNFLLLHNIEFIVSYGYRYIIRKEILEHLPFKVINLHISYLPFNKGADPNFWSFIEDSPKGVSIHLVDEKLDTGDILVQEKVELSDRDTFRVTYDLLHSSIIKLFKKNWSDIKSLQIEAVKQSLGGTTHKFIEKERLLNKVDKDWLDIPINKLLLSFFK